jgi:hypothetical protein
VVATAKGRAHGWGDTDTPPDLHVIGGDVLLVREVTGGTELRPIKKDASVAWARLLPPLKNNPLRLSFLDDRRIGLHGSHFEPATVVLDGSTGTEVTRLNLHSEEALLSNDALLAIENDTLVVRNLQGRVRWQRTAFAPGWDPNHRLASLVIGDLLIVAWYHSIGPNIHLAAFTLADGTAKWSQDLETKNWKQKRKPFYHNLVSLEAAAGHLVVTIDESQGMTVLICDPSRGDCWWRESQEWKEPLE